MKKMLFGLAALSLVALTGCGKKNEVVCTSNMKEDGVEAKIKVTGKLKDNKIDSVKATMTFNSKEDADKYCGIMALVAGMAGDEKKLEYTCKGKTITINNYDQLSDEEEDKSVIGMSKEDFIKEMESSSTDDGKVTCK